MNFLFIPYFILRKVIGKGYATIPKGNVGDFESTVLQKIGKNGTGGGKGGGGKGSNGHMFACAKRKQSPQT